MREDLLVLAMLTAVLVAIVLAVGRGLVRWLVSARGLHAASIVRASAWGAAGLVAALAVLSLTRAGHPPPEGYVASLPVVATIPPHAGSDVVPEEARAGDVMVRRVPYRDPCGLVFGDEGPRPSTADERVLSLDEAEGASDFSACGALTIRADQARGFWIVTNAGESAAYSRSSPARAGVLRPRDLPGALRPPHAFTALAVAGLLAAVVLLRRRPPPPDLPADEPLCRDTVVAIGGQARIDGELLPLPAGPPPAGEAIIAVLSAPTVSFREAAATRIVRVEPGTMTERRLAAALWWPALALVLISVAGAPLAAALWALR